MSVSETGQDLGTTLIGRARELREFLADNAPRTEAARQVLPEVFDALGSGGLLSVGAPSTFGGQAVDIDTMFEIGIELGRGCASTAWCWTLWAAHAWFMGHATPEAQAELFADGPAVILSSGVRPNGAVIELTDGGCRLSGRWSFSSGVDYADWITFAGPPPGGPGTPDIGALLLVPRSQVVIEDDWFVMGLRGTGSKTVTIEEPVFVPEHRFVRMAGAEAGPAKETHARLSYGLPHVVAAHYVQAASILGPAQAAVDTFADQLAARRHTFTGAKKAESVAMQMRIGESAAAMDSALSLARMDMRGLLAQAARDEPMTVEQRSRARLHQAHMLSLARFAVNRLYEVSGTAAILEGSPIQRMFRDVQAGSQHVAFQWDEHAESYGRVRVGLEPNAMFS